LAGQILRVWRVFAFAVLLGLSSSVGAEPRLDYCAAATAATAHARSEAERLHLLREAATEASQELDRAFWLFKRAVPVVGSSSRPFPLNQPEERQRLERAFFFFTVGHWLDVKVGICRCLSERDREDTDCARLSEEIAHSCDLEPASPGIKVRCLTKGR